MKLRTVRIPQAPGTLELNFLLGKEKSLKDLTQGLPHLDFVSAAPGLLPGEGRWSQAPEAGLSYGSHRSLLADRMVLANAHVLSVLSQCVPSLASQPICYRPP